MTADAICHPTSLGIWIRRLVAAVALASNGRATVLASPALATGEVVGCCTCSAAGGAAACL